MIVIIIAIIVIIVHFEMGIPYFKVRPGPKGRGILHLALLLLSRFSRVQLCVTP